MEPEWTSELIQSDRQPSTATEGTFEVMQSHRQRSTATGTPITQRTSLPSARVEHLEHLQGCRLHRLPARSVLTAL